MIAALYPKWGKPWAFGMHQCSYARVWTTQENRLFKEIGRRISDGLSSVLFLRELQENEERFRATFEQAAVGIAHVALDGQWMRVNQKLCDIVGYSREELLQKTFQDITHPDDLAASMEHVRRLLAGEVSTHSMEKRYLRKDGAPVWINLTGSVVCNTAGEPAYLIGVIEDITNRKQSEEQLRHLKNYLANIIDSMPSMLVGMDSDEIVTQWNHQAERSTGIPAAEAIGQPIAHVFPDFFPWIKAMRDELTHRHPSSMEKLLVEKQGERHFFDLVLYPLVANGVEGAVIRVEDVTERTRVQEMLVQAEKMMSVGGLAAGMAHEVNNPLGIILQSIQNIKRRITPELPANQKAAEELGFSVKVVNDYCAKRQILEFIDNIHEASARAAKIVANMLQFSRRSGSVMQPCSLATLLEQALELAASDYDLKRKFDFKNIEIVRDYAPDMPDIPVVQVEIEQVMLNLLRNAAQAMAATTTQERKPRITLRLRCEGGYAQLEVEDNGPGMEEEVRRRVFEPFFTTKSPGSGTGLGLSVSYMLVTQRHKGLLEVVSLPGKGTCFSVRLPLAKPASNDG